MHLGAIFVESKGCSVLWKLHGSRQPSVRLSPSGQKRPEWCDRENILPNQAARVRKTVRIGNLAPATMLLSFSSSLCARRVVYWRHRSSLSQNYRLFHAGNVLCRQLPKRELSEPEAKWKTPGVELPPLEEWWKIFRYSELRKRRTIKNPETAKMLAELYVPEGSKDKVIIEAWAGA